MIPADSQLLLLEIGMHSVITDVHSHYFRYPEHFSPDFAEQARRARSNIEIELTVRWEQYCAEAKQCGKTIIFGGKAKRAGIWVPDLEIAKYVKDHSENLIGFL